MTSATLRDVGGSVVLAIPKKILSLVDLHAGSKVRIGVEKNRLVIEPERTTRYTLAELLERCQQSDLALNGRGRAWLRGVPVGGEEI